jgi:peptidoglycan/LPS O-acetylase OafA/YrhL
MHRLVPERAYAPTVVSRVAGAAAALLTVLGGLYIWGLARSPDSSWRVGLALALPFLGFAAALALVAFWTRRSPPRKAEKPRAGG